MVGWTPAVLTHPLAGFRVAVTADRTAAEQAALLEGQGADVLLAPTAELSLLPADERWRTQLDALAAPAVGATVVATGLAARALADSATTLGRLDAVVEALGARPLVVRDGEAASELRGLGLAIDAVAASGTNNELAAVLGEIAADADRVAVVGDHDDGCALRSLGYDIALVAPYRWRLPTELQIVEHLVDEVADGRIDAVTFTEPASALHLTEVAQRTGRIDEVRASFESGMVAIALGPETVVAAESAGLRGVRHPERRRLGSMVRLMTSIFLDRAVELRYGDGVVRWQGSTIWVDGAAVPLAQRERGILEALAERPGVVWSKERLRARVWGDTDPTIHVVEVTVGRLRKRLGPAGSIIETVTRRGYRLWSDPLVAVAR